MTTDFLLERQKRIISTGWERIRLGDRKDLREMAKRFEAAGFTPVSVVSLSTPILHKILNNMVSAGVIEFPKKFLEPALISEFRGAVAAALSGKERMTFITATELLDARRRLTLKTGLSFLDGEDGAGVSPLSILVAGQYGSGKTQLTMWVAAAAVAQGRLAMIIDTENGFNPSRFSRLVDAAAERLGVEAPEAPMDKALVAQCGTVDNIYAMLPQIAPAIASRDAPLGVIIVDSLSAPIRGDFAGRGQRTVKDAADVLKPLMKTMEELASIYGVPVFTVGHVYENIGFFTTGYRISGGNIVGHMNNAIVMLRRIPRTRAGKCEKAASRLGNPSFSAVSVEKYFHRESVLVIADEGVFDCVDLLGGGSNAT